MGRKREREPKPRRDVETEAEALVDRAAAPDVSDLFDIIRRVNPTGLDLPEATVARRYRLKARLQSLLIRHHGKELRVVDDAENPGVVTLSHRYSRLDSSHAVIDELDEDARAEVRLRLDVGEDDSTDDVPARAAPGRRAAAALPSKTTTDAAADATDDWATLLGEGREAFAAYDYERSEELFRAAFELSPERVEPALALLELLVDHLGSDLAALELTDRFSDAVARDAQVRILVATAAARHGDVEHAADWVRGTSGPRVADVLLLLAEAALHAGDATAAERWLAEAREMAPADARTVHLAQEAAKVRARSRQPEEEALETIYQNQGAEAAESRARRILEQWPDSRVARRILREIEEQRRLEERQDLLARIEKALALGNLTLARQMMAGVTEPLDEQATVLAAHIRTADEQAAREREQQQIDAVAQALSRDFVAGLAAYLELDQKTRAEVREQVSLPALTWLDELGLGVSKGGGRARGAAVEAVLALVKAIDALGRGDPETALGELLPHAKLLEDLPRAREVTAEANRTVAKRRRDAAEEQLRAATVAAEAGNTAEAGRLLASLDAKVLSTETRERMRELEAFLRRRDEVSRLAAMVDDYVNRGMLADARASTETLAALCEGAEREAWLAMREELSARLHTEWRVWESEVGCRPDVLTGLPSSPGALSDDVHTWLSADGNEMWFCQPHGRWVFFWTADTQNGLLNRIGRMRTPDPLGSLPVVHLVDGSLWIVGERHVLELGTDRLEVRSYRSLSRFAAPDENIESALVVPGSGELWIRTDRRMEGGAVRVIDTRTWRQQRELEDTFNVTLLGGLDPPRIACLDLDGYCQFYLARGSASSAERGQLENEHVEAREIAVHPTGAGLVAVAPSEQYKVLGDDAEPDATMELVVLPPLESRAACRAVANEAGQQDKQTIILENSDDDRVHTVVATALDEHCSFVLFGHPGGEIELRAFGIHQQHFLKELWRARVPAGTLLLRDARERHVVALVPTDNGAEIVRLGQYRHRFGGAVAGPPSCALPDVHPPFYCGPLITAERGSRVAERMANIHRLSPGERSLWLQRSLEEYADSPDDLAALCFHLRRDEIETVARFGHQRHPTNIHLASARAEDLLRHHDWAGARAVLLALNPTQIGEEAKKHYAHLLGVALLRLGDYEAARQVWKQGLDLEGRCRLEDCLELLQPLPRRLRSADWGPDQLLVRQLLGAVHTADQCLATGDTAGVLAALGRADLIDMNQEQLQARLVEAFLRDEPASTVGRFQMAVALARFCNPPYDDVLLGDGLPIPGATWPEQRLEELRARAQAWLEREIRA
ncbi:MAG: hypothetical protein V2A73_20275 [Pseudomonadota bacterium]